MKRVILIITLLIMLVLIIGITINSASLPNAPVKIAIKGEPTSLNPHQSKTIWDQFVAYALFDRLVKYDEKMRIVPSLAESWTTPDPYTWNIKLRENVTFHNGEPLTTEDVIFSFDRIKDEFPNYSGVFANIDAYHAIDENNLMIKTIIPYDFLNYFNNIFIVPKDYIMEVGNEQFALNPVGSGMYKFESGNTSDVHLKSNEKYWASVELIPELEIRYVPRDLQYDALINGEIDIVQDLLPDEYEKLKEFSSFEGYIGRSNLFHYLGMNLSDAKQKYISLDVNPLHDIRVREAISLAIDINMINDSIFDGKAFPSSQLGDSGVFGYNPDIEMVQQDIDKARGLMREAGYPEGFDITIHTPMGTRYQIGQIIGRQLSAINIKATVLEIEDKLFWQELFKEDHDYSMFIGGFSVGPVIDHTLNTLFHTRNSDGKGRLNFFRYSNSNVDDFLEKAATTNKIETKGEYLREANRMIMAEKPIIPLYSMPRYYGIENRINWKPLFSSQIRLENIRLKKEENWFEKMFNWLW